MTSLNSPDALAAEPAAGWLQQRERSNAFWLRLMAWIALRCGRTLARVVLHPITVYFLLFSPTQRRHSQRYLTRALGRPAAWSDSYRHFHTFAATILDRVYFLRENDARFDLHLHGTELLDETLAAGRGAFLVGAHLGSFEALRVIGHERPQQRIAMVMFPDNARLINEALAALAPGAKQDIIALGRRESMLAIRDWLDAGGLAGMLADRGLPPTAEALAMSGGRDGRVSVSFLGHPAAFIDGPFRLAALLRRRVIFMAGLYEGGARYQLRFETLADFSAGFGSPGERERAIRAAIEAYVARLEALSRSHPNNWFNFHDVWSQDAV